METLNLEFNLLKYLLGNKGHFSWRTNIWISKWQFSYSHIIRYLYFISLHKLASKTKQCALWVFSINAVEVAWYQHLIWISFFVFWQTTVGMDESCNDGWQRRLQICPGYTNWKIIFPLFVDIVSHTVTYHYYSPALDIKLFNMSFKIWHQVVYEKTK